MEGTTFFLPSLDILKKSLLYDREISSFCQQTKEQLHSCNLKPVTKTQ
jgi:hypothetical protein